MRRLRGGAKLAGVRGGAAVAFCGVGARREQNTNGIDVWGMCSARALARRGRRPLQRALHRDGEVAAAQTFLGSAARVARPGGSSSRQQEGEELVRDAWAPAHGGVMAGKAGKALHGGAVGGRRREAEQGGEEGDKGDFAISKSSRD